MLKRLGFVAVTRSVKVPRAGVEADISAFTQTGVEVVFECKVNTAETDRKGGLADTDNVKKAIADGFLIGTFGDSIPYMVLTNRMPTNGRAKTMVANALETVWTDAFNIDNESDVVRPRSVAGQTV